VNIFIYSIYIYTYRLLTITLIIKFKVEYSPWTLDIETNGIMEACRELDVTIVAYSPLGRGFLTVFILFITLIPLYMNNIHKKIF
jgi:predicted oxidoreductase